MNMFRPRVYRSSEGCCICKTKSSSSRFVDSQRYAEDIAKCFNLEEPRHGLICNACVLWIKRYKVLPEDSDKNAGYDEDARAGPSTKMLMQVKRKKIEKRFNNTGSQSRHIGKTIITEKFKKIFKKSKKTKLELSPSGQTQISLAKPNSVDSDNKEGSESSQELSETNSTAPPITVLFQTQTRASALLSKHKAANNETSTNNNPAVQIKSNDLIICEPKTKIFGSKKRKNFKPHKRQQPFINEKYFDESDWIKRKCCCGIIYESAEFKNLIIIDVEKYKVCEYHQVKEKKLDELQQTSTLNLLPKPKCAIKATLPTVVKLSLPCAALNSNINSTPVLKKHIFFKREIESFPQDDLMGSTAQSSTILKTDNTEKIVTANTENGTNALQKQHSSALITPIILAQPPTVNSDVPDSFNLKSSSFLHKIKSGAGKIVKHSFEKINSAVRLKSQDLSEVKNLVKTVDKNYLLAMPTASTSPSKIVVANTEKITSVTEDLSSKTENSSDSGFDENVQDRKSVSPKQQENDVKNILPQRPPVQTLILASGARVHGQPQNVVFAGNEAASKILKKRLAMQNSNAVLQSNKRSQSITKTPSICTLKLQLTKNKPNCLVSIGTYGGVKMRSLYNKNAIKHENGITTILPASSLAAANQASEISMQVNAPNTITITPAATALDTRPKTSSLPYVQSRVAYQQSLSDNLTHIHNRKAI